MRLFICCEPDPAVCARLWSCIRQLRATNAPASWTAEQNLHLTLKFLGDSDASRLERIVSAAHNACADERSFEMVVAGVGAFPQVRRPRVVWAGVSEGAESLQRLQRKMESAFSVLGFRSEERPFHPHITLGRVRRMERVGSPSTERLGSLSAEIEKWRDVELGPSSVSEFVLMRSELRSTGAVYTPLERIPLKR